MRACAISLLAVLAGCQSSGDSPLAASAAANNTTAPTNNVTAPVTNTSGETTMPTPDPDCGETVVANFRTSDGVELAADFHPAAHPNRGAVVLFHMIPPTWDRSSYPMRVREALHALDLNVLSVDRRGSGDSTGTPMDAYQGETASLDVEAAVRFLLSRDRACPIDRTKLMLVGASNGTTSIFDYTVARSDSDLPTPAAMVWLSPGGYTEAQNDFAENRGALETLPLLIIHPDNEPWATQLTAVPPAWKVVEIADGRHGTQNFDNGAREAVQLPALVDWARTHVAQ